MAASGTTTVEAKSGYGLRTDDELKILRAIAAAGHAAEIDVVPTFLGAHAVLQNSRPGPRPTSISSGKRCCRRLRRIGSRTSVMHSSTEGTSRPTRPERS